jgi:hypothetical protein
MPAVLEIGFKWHQRKVRIHGTQVAIRCRVVVVTSCCRRVEFTELHFAVNVKGHHGLLNLMAYFVGVTVDTEVVYFRSV